jgi:hypothetical protein
MQNTAHDDENVDKPWNSSLFDGMQLDKVKTKCSESSLVPYYCNIKTMTI